MRQYTSFTGINMGTVMDTVTATDTVMVTDTVMDTDTAMEAFNIAKDIIIHPSISPQHGIVDGVGDMEVMGEVGVVPVRALMAVDMEVVMDMVVGTLGDNNNDVNFLNLLYLLYLLYFIINLLLE